MHAIHGTSQSHCCSAWHAHLSPAFLTFATILETQFLNCVSLAVNLEHNTSSACQHSSPHFPFFASVPRGFILRLLPLRSLESEVAEKNVRHDQAVAYKKIPLSSFIIQLFKSCSVTLYQQHHLLWGERWGQHHEETFQDGFLCAKVCV